MVTHVRRALHDVARAADAPTDKFGKNEERSDATG
jgi:hypothetical protein